MAQEGDEGDGDTHCNEDCSDFGQAAPCERAHLWVSRELHCSDGYESNPRCLKGKFNKKIKRNIEPNVPSSASSFMLLAC